VCVFVRMCVRMCVYVYVYEYVKTNAITFCSTFCTRFGVYLTAPWFMYTCSYLFNHICVFVHCMHLRVYVCLYGYMQYVCVCTEHNSCVYLCGMCVGVEMMIY